MGGKRAAYSPDDYVSALNTCTTCTEHIVAGSYRGGSPAAAGAAGCQYMRPRGPRGFGVGVRGPAALARLVSAGRATPRPAPRAAQSPVDYVRRLRAAPAGPPLATLGSSLRGSDIGGQGLLQLSGSGRASPSSVARNESSHRVRLCQFVRRWRPPSRFTLILFSECRPAPESPTCTCGCRDPYAASGCMGRLQPAGSLGPGTRAPSTAFMCWPGRPRARAVRGARPNTPHASPPKKNPQALHRHPFYYRAVQQQLMTPPRRPRPLRTHLLARAP